jgi:hypothetical protein
MAEARSSSNTRISVSRSRRGRAAFCARIRSRSSRRTPIFGCGCTLRSYSKAVSSLRMTLQPPAGATGCFYSPSCGKGAPVYWLKRCAGAASLAPTDLAPAVGPTACHQSGSDLKENTSSKSVANEPASIGTLP